MEDKMKNTRKSFTRNRLFKVLIFLYIWLMVGFSTGTAVLMGPVRWLAQAGRNQGFSTGLEDTLVKGIIVLFVILSFLVSLMLSRAFNRSPGLHVKIGIPALATAFALASLYLWLNPRLAGSDVVIEQSANVQFTFGPYPEEADLEELKQEGYTAVISLLHPAVVPFEPVLQEQEEEAARKVGIEIIHLPMLPWISENQDVLDSIRTLAEKSGERYYVHCYLGKDRVNVVRRMVESTGNALVDSGEKSTARRIDDMEAFERGEIVRLDQGVYLVPYPTDEEWLGFILAGDIEYVVSLLDPANPDDVPWIEKEHQLANQYGLGFSLEPISAVDYDPYQVLEIAGKIRDIPKPMVIHSFLAPSFRTQAMIQAYRSGKPPLPPDLFSRPLAGGKVTMVAPNVATGPRPEGTEFGAVLSRLGIREFIYTGESGNTQAAEDSVITSAANLTWRSVEDKDQLYRILSAGGPYYVYDNDVAGLTENLAERLGPAVPDSVLVIRDETVETLSADSSGQEGRKGLIGFTQDFLDRALPDLKLTILLSPLLLIYAGTAAWFSGWLRTKRKVRAPYTRKVFHFLVFTMAAVLQIAIGLPAVILFGIIVSLVVVYAVLRGKGFAHYEAMARESDAPRRTLFILIPLASTALGGVIANLFFPQFSAIGYLVAGWGDAVGEPVGTRWGKHRYRVPSLGKVKATRSLEGSLAIFLVGTVVSFGGLLLLGVPLMTGLWVAAVAGLSGALVEAFSNHGLDNLTVQVGVSAVVWVIFKLIS